MHYASMIYFTSLEAPNNKCTIQQFITLSQYSLQPHKHLTCLTSLGAIFSYELTQHLVIEIPNLSTTRGTTLYKKSSNIPCSNSLQLHGIAQDQSMNIMTHTIHNLASIDLKTSHHQIASCQSFSISSKTDKHHITTECRFRKPIACKPFQDGINLKV